MSVPKIDLISEQELKPDVNKLQNEYKVPEHLIDFDYKLYEIHLKCADVTDLGLIKTALWFIPVKKLCRGNNTIYSDSVKIVPGGKCLPDGFQFIWNNIEMADVPESLKPEQQVKIQLKNFNRDQDKLVEYPIIWNK